MKSGIELRHLSYFVRLAEELHFGRAAERLGMAQAPLSQQIRQLEDRIGARLFARTTRRVTLTPAGVIFLEHAREVLAAVDQAVSHVRAISAEETGRLVIGGVQLALSHFLPAIIRRFRERHPAVVVDVVPLTTADQLRTLETGEINIAFIRPTTLTGFMQMERLHREGFVAVLPSEHRLARKTDLRLRELAGDSIVGYAPILGASYSNVMLDAFRKAGIRPRIVQEASHTQSIVTLVAAGVGIGVVPSWAQYLPVPGLVYRPIRDLPEVIELAVAWPTGDRSTVVRDFVEIARAARREVTRPSVDQES